MYQKVWKFYDEVQFKVDWELRSDGVVSFKVWDGKEITILMGLSLQEAEQLHAMLGSAIQDYQVVSTKEVV